jgi:hypothetical protein
MIPLVVRFAQRIPPVSPEILRCDEERQIVQVLANGNWIDRLTAGGQGPYTKHTRTKNETTDDE